MDSDNRRHQPTRRARTLPINGEEQPVDNGSKGVEFGKVDSNQELRGMNITYLLKIHILTYFL